MHICVGVVSALLLGAIPTPVFAQLNVESGTIDVDLIVEGCNNNLVCEAIIGEDTATCPLDCPEPPPVATPTPSVTGESSPRTSNKRSVEPSEDGSATTNLLISELGVTPSVTQALITFETNMYAIASVRVGQTVEYEERAVAEFGYRRSHELLVSGLLPGTTYVYELFVAGALGGLERVYGTFTTDDALSIPSIARPLLSRPGDVHVDIVDGTAFLEWSNPVQIGFSEVVIVRTVEKPAREPSDGVLVYQGVENGTVDTGIVPNSPYFYTFFARYRDVFSDGVFIETPYDDDVVAGQMLEQFAPRFGDEQFSVFDFSVKQQGVTLEWENRSLIAAPLEQTVIHFKKPDFFGPLEDVYVEALVYDSSGLITERRFQKLSFRTERYAYETVFDPFDQNQTVLLTFKIFRADGTFSYVRAKMHVGQLSFYETSSGVGGTSCRGFAIGFAHFKNVLWCAMPWPMILAVALLAVCMHYIRKMLRI